MQKFGIDVSRWQGDFDFKRAKEKEGVEFAILKIGGGDDGLYQDSKFADNYNKCTDCGLDKGCYFFGHAMNMDEAKAEAEYILQLLKGKKFEYPFFYDVEADMLKLKKRELTDIIKYVLFTVEAAGYWAGIYTSESHFNSKIYDNELAIYSHWVAKYSDEAPKISNDVQMWQFGGSVNYLRDTNINGQTVDQNYCYIDYPSAVKSAGLNGYTSEGTPEVTAPEKSIEELAQEVLAGKWGNGAERKQRLAEAGYDYDAVQNRVNQLCAPVKSVDELAREVIRGLWGTGQNRKDRLTQAGYDYNAVQKRVNELM